MKTDKEKLAEATHALNELYEVVEEFYYNDFTGVRPEIEEALEKADKVLEGN